MPELKEWERDLINRQRNIVFPDTVLNEGRFYRNIFSRDAEFTRGQRAALVFFGFCLMISACYILAGSIAELLQTHDVASLAGIVHLCLVGVTAMIGVGCILRGLFPPKPTRLMRLRRYRRPSH